MIRKSPMHPTNSLYLLTLLVWLLVASAGCERSGKKPESPQPSTPTVKPSAGAAVQKQVSSVTLPPVQTNQFDFSNKKDPFKPYVVADKTAAKARLTAGKDVLPILSFDVSQFRLIGVVADPRGNKAMVVDPSGKAYVLRVGTTIGKNEGKVRQISTAGVDVIEQFRDDNGKLRKETIRIPLLRKP